MSAATVREVLDGALAHVHPKATDDQLCESVEDQNLAEDDVLNATDAEAVRFRKGYTERELAHLRAKHLHTVKLAGALSKASRQERAAALQRAVQAEQDAQDLRDAATARDLERSRKLSEYGSAGVIVSKETRRAIAKEKSDAAVAAAKGKGWPNLYLPGETLKKIGAGLKVKRWDASTENWVEVAAPASLSAITKYLDDYLAEQGSRDTVLELAKGRPWSALTEVERKAFAAAAGVTGRIAESILRKGRP